MEDKISNDVDINALDKFVLTHIKEIKESRETWDSISIWNLVSGSGAVTAVDKYFNSTENTAAHTVDYKNEELQEMLER